MIFTAPSFCCDGATEDEPQSSERTDIERLMQAQIDGLQALVAREQDLANVKGALLGLASVTLAQAIEEGWLRDPTTTVDALNQTLAQRGLSWRLVRPN